MNHCVIAAKENNEFMAVLCIQESQLFDTLNQYYNTSEGALSVIAQGDLNRVEADKVNSFHKDWGISWCYTQPQHFTTQEELEHYCEASGIEQMIMFEQDHWERKEFDCYLDWEPTFNQDMFAA